MAIVSIDKILESDNIEKTFKVLKSEVKWGRPQNALYYRKLVSSLLPRYYWRVQYATTSIASIGTNRIANLTTNALVGNYISTPSYIDNTITASKITIGYHSSSSCTLKTSTKGYSVSFWMRLDKDDYTGDATLFFKGTSRASANTFLGCAIRKVNNKNLLVALHGSSQESVQTNTDTTITVNTWNNVVINILSNNRCEIYLNGINVFTGTTAVNCNATHSSAFILSAETTTPTNQFVGCVSEFFALESSLSSNTVKKLYQIGATKSYYEPDKDLDTTAFYSNLKQKTYYQIVNDLGAINHWTLDVTNTAVNPPTLADRLTNNALKCFGTTATNGNTASMISTLNGAGGSKIIPQGYGNYLESTTAENFSKANEELTEVSLRCIFKLYGYSRDADAFMGYTNADSLPILNGYMGAGFYVYVYQNNLYLNIGAGGLSPNPNLIEGEYGLLLTNNQLQANSLYTLTLTISNSGTVKSYINEELQKTHQVAWKGIKVPHSTQRFTVGTRQSLGFKDIPQFQVDEIILFEKALSYGDISILSKVQKFGPTYESSLDTTNNITVIDNYVQNNNPYAELINTVDITKYVESYSMQKDFSNIIDSATLIFVDGWNQQEVVVAPGEYIVIQEKWYDVSNGNETEFFDVGHFKVEGSPAYEINSTTKNTSVILRSLLGYIQDIITTKIEADKILIPKTKFDSVTNIGTYRKYKLSNPNNPNRFYDTWAAYPSPKLWVTDFNNLSDAAEGGISSATEQVRIKGSNGGIQIDYGEGAVIANLLYLTDPITQNGLSDPQSVYAEFYRYLVPSDIEYNVQIKSILFNEISNRWAIGLSRKLTCDQLTVFVESGVAKGNIYKIYSLGNLYYMVDMNGYQVSPLDEGIAVNDIIRIGDANLGVDVLRKILIASGFQENDPLKPFYFSFGSVPQELSPTVPLIEYTPDDNQSMFGVLENVLTFLPPDFKLVISDDGKIVGDLYGLNSLYNEKIILTNIVDTNADNTDFGVVTKVVAEGETQVPVNVGLHQTYGGTSACRAYKLDNFALNYTSLNGSTLSQVNADALLAQIMSGNPKIPIPSGTGWEYGNPSFNRHYGVIYSRYGDPVDVKRWNFEDTDFMAVDIGIASNGAAILVDQIDMVFLNHIIEGSAIAQSIEIYYMTQQDYEAEYNKALPNIPSISDTSYFPDKNSKNWKLLVDEFAMSEGLNSKTSADFVGGKQLPLRFLKFRIGQCQHRFKMTSGFDKDKVMSRFGLTDLRIYTSKKIVASAELGITAPFNSPDHKILAAKFRRRTEYISSLYFLDTYEKALDYAITQLQEKFKEYAPYTITTINPKLNPGTQVTVYNPETKEKKYYVVVASSKSNNFESQHQLINYEVVI